MIEVGRRPVLILWATIVAERLGFERNEALTLGRAVARLGGRMSEAALDVITPGEIAELRANLRPGGTIDVRVIDRVVSIARVPEGLRAVVKNRPIDPASVEAYLGEKFGNQIDNVAEAMITLAEALPVSLLAECAFELYEQFRPETSELDIDRITACIRTKPRGDAATDDEPLDEDWCEDAQGEMPSFRGPQALIGGGMVPSHRVEPLRRERTALAPIDHGPAGVADAPTTGMRRRAIGPPVSPQPRLVAVSPVTRPMPTRGGPAHRPTSPVVLVLAVFLAGAVGGGVGALLVAPSERTNVMAELADLLARHRQTLSALSEMFDPEPTQSAVSSDPSASSPDIESTAVDMSPPLPPATAVVPSSSTMKETPEHPPVDSDGAFEVARMNRDDEASGSEPIPVRISTPLAAATAVVPSSSTENERLENPLVDNDGGSEVARVEPPSTTVNGAPEHPPVDSHASPEVAGIAMARGDERMRQGDVVAARRFYEMAAGAGMVQAATAMGRTFDPLYLRHLRVRGAFADAERAKQWYENAAKAGDMEALARIELMTWNSSHR
ncbi:MAG TPA: hypothetical protein VGU20_01605 [Stellaceae bacterium]|nr:hypothetical protein [Stellaceae bacterium]